MKPTIREMIVRTTLIVEGIFFGVLGISTFVVWEYLPLNVQIVLSGVLVFWFGLLVYMVSTKVNTGKEETANEG